MQKQQLQTERVGLLVLVKVNPTLILYDQGGVDAMMIEQRQQQQAELQAQDAKARELLQQLSACQVRSLQWVVFTGSHVVKERCNSLEKHNAQLLDDQVFAAGLAFAFGSDDCTFLNLTCSMGSRSSVQ